MQKITIFCLVVAFGTFIMASSPLESLSETSNVEELWPLYKAKHNKSYTPEEDAERKEIFKDTVKRIVEHNKKYEKKEVTYTMGLNHFADRKPDEVPTGYGKKE